jgi:hypothetical protein
MDFGNNEIDPTFRSDDGVEQIVSPIPIGFRAYIDPSIWSVPGVPWGVVRPRSERPETSDILYERPSWVYVPGCEHSPPTESQIS